MILSNNQPVKSSFLKRVIELDLQILKNPDLQFIAGKVNFRLFKWRADHGASVILYEKLSLCTRAYIFFGILFRVIAYVKKFRHKFHDVAIKFYYIGFNIFMSYFVP